MKFCNLFKITEAAREQQMRGSGKKFRSSIRKEIVDETVWKSIAAA